MKPPPPSDENHGMFTDHTPRPSPSMMTGSFRSSYENTPRQRNTSSLGMAAGGGVNHPEGKAMQRHDQPNHPSYYHNHPSHGPGSTQQPHHPNTSTTNHSPSTTTANRATTTTGRTKNSVQTRRGTFMGPLPPPKPREPSKCPVFCCFYAEFDYQVGPQIVYQCPPNFMDLPVGVPIHRVHRLLDQTFRDLQHSSNTTNNNTSSVNAYNSTSTLPTSNMESSHKSNPPPTEKSEQRPTKEQQQQQPKESSSSSEEEAHKLSIFDTFSEYIITGNELSGNVIKLSAHDMHLVTHPTVIVDNEQYARNSLFFAVGFVLRRSFDARPFQPIISKWAKTLRELELESQYLSTAETRQTIQSHTEQIFVSLNSLSRECNLLINAAHVLHLKLFHPPRVPAFPVPDYAVPVLLLRDWRQCQVNYDWDLAIDWCGRHIDGIRNAQQISEKAEVDMEMVRACLRVLKHHGVIALCDMFFYSNRYEATERATAILAGQESKLLLAATEHAVRSSPSLAAATTADGNPSSRDSLVVDGNGSNTSLHAMGGGGGGTASSPGTTEEGGSLSSGCSRTFVAGGPGNLRMTALPATPSSEAHFSLSSQTNHTHVHSKLGGLIQELKPAVAEFYTRCERKRSLADTWVSLVGSSSRTRRSESIHPPGTLGSHSSPGVDWKRAFRQLDHRRLISFGVVHGLIRRVHRVPRVRQKPKPPVPPPQQEQQRRATDDPVLIQPTAPPQQLLHLQREDSTLPDAGAGGPRFIGPMLHVPPSGGGGVSSGSVSSLGAGAGHHHPYFYSRRKLNSWTVASKMDGMHCDDELVCEFQKSFDELMEMVVVDENVSITLVPATCYGH